MGRPELGTKCTCTSCAERFYDLNRVPATCPKCGAEQPPVQLRMFRPSRSTVEFRRPARQAVPVVAEEDADQVSVVDAADEDEDEDDVPEVDDDIDEDVPIVPGHDATPV
jgi:uncharacterized protein (TIGR02300 family)